MSNWLTVIIVLLIVIILADGFRRNYKLRQNRLDVSPALNKRQKDFGDDNDLDNYSSELPNGGARVVGHRDSRDTPVSSKKTSAKEKRETRRKEETVKRNPEQTKLDLEKSVPILMESVVAQPELNEADAKYAARERIEPTFSARSPVTEVEDDLFDQHAEHEDAHYDEHEEYEDEEGYENEAYDEDYEDEYEDDEPEEEYEEEVEESSSSQAQPEEVFIINVMAPKGKFFHGADLLDATLKCGLRYGNMDIFHRYSTTKGEGVLLFSMANMVKPGTFDLDAMDEFDTPGVSLFMTLPIDADSMKSFELMVDTANVLAEALDGELKDEQRSAMTRQTIEHCRQRISDFERKKLFRRSR